MFCSKCGAQIPDHVSFCAYCGNAVQPMGEAPTEENRSLVPNNTPAPYQQPAWQQPMGYPFPMKWYKFLIYFSLFASTVMNGTSGFQSLFGIQYGTAKELVYRTYSGLQALDIVMGIGMIAIAVLALYTRFRLSGFHKNGPKMLTILYLCVVILNAGYILGLMLIVPEIGNTTEIIASIASTMMSLIILFVNREYFRRRASLFVND